jgi:hypothetical protein
MAESSTPDMIEQTLSVTFAQLDAYIEHKGCGSPCEACGKKQWVFPETDGQPDIYMTPHVRNPTLSNWYFPIECGHCANTRFLSAGKLWQHFFGEVSANG